MAIGKDFTFTKNLEVGRLHTPKVCKVAKDYRDACEHCSSDIIKGTFVLCAKEVVSRSNGFGVRTVKTHRLCASCTADYIKATSVQTPEPTYEERQAEWVKANNVKTGTKIRIIRKWKRGDSGFDYGMGATIGETYDVTHILDNHIAITEDWAVPYFALEVIKEPTYRPFNNDELNDLVGKIVVRTCDGNKMLVTGRSNPMKVRLGNDCTYTAEQLLELFTLDGKPCGVKEEA